MIGKRDETRVEDVDNRSALPCEETESEPRGTNRRELIKRYGKYAVAAGPLLFVSKAHAIRSAP